MAWLEASEGAADVWVEVGELLEELGPAGMLASAEGRAAIAAAVADFYREADTASSVRS